MQEGLEEAGGATLEEVPTISACPMIQTTFDTYLECKVTALCMELSMNHGEEDHFELFTTTMPPVLCAMLQQGWQSQ